MQIYSVYAYILKFMQIYAHFFKIHAYIIWYANFRINRMLILLAY